MNDRQLICNSSNGEIPLLSSAIHSSELRKVLLMLASQRIESFVSGWFWTTSDTNQYHNEAPTKRGAQPSAVEWLILAWVSGKLLYANVPCTMSYLYLVRIDMERGETTVGHWFARVCQRYVECH